MATGFEILGEIRNVETIAAGRGVHIRRHLDRMYGPERWRKMKGMGVVRFADGTVCDAEIHWFESHGIGRKDFKIKRTIR
jgi:hypothetical protein